jgi:predicted GIY-YIG superfamily endonuclease
MATPNLQFRRRVKRPRFRTVKPPPVSPGSYHAYVLQCIDGSYYVSSACDVQKSIDDLYKRLGVTPAAAKQLFHLIMHEGAYPEEGAASRALCLEQWAKDPAHERFFVDFMRMHISLYNK